MLMSIICILISEVLKHYDLAGGKPDKHKRTETWRNVWLLLGQLSFLLTSGQGDNVSFVACELFAAFTHLAWLIFWSWTGIEGIDIEH